MFSRWFTVDMSISVLGHCHRFSTGQGKSSAWDPLGTRRVSNTVAPRTVAGNDHMVMQLKERLEKQSQKFEAQQA